MTRAIWLGILAGNLLGCYAWREAGATPTRAHLDGATAAAVYECITSMEPETSEDWRGAVGECTDGVLDTAGWGWN